MSNKSYINISQKNERLIVLIDMDCFYCQVEEKLNPQLKNLPIAVVQYNNFQGGGIIAVNYPAREKGVTRHMRGNEAKEKCPEIELVRVPNIGEKADLSKYRNAGNEVAKVLQTYTNQFEKASVDEAYLDITDKVSEKLRLINEKKFTIEPAMLVNTYAYGYSMIGDFVQNLSKLVSNHEYDNKDNYSKDSDIKLLIAASICNEIRAGVKEITGYECSAGIAHNKILAKLACGINKPNKQTVLPLTKIDSLLRTLPLNKIRGLGGKFGKIVEEKLQIQFIGDLLNFSEQELQKHFEQKNGSWLHLIARGIDLEMVTPRFLSKSIGCCKKFPGKTAITGLATLNHWLLELTKEIKERLEKDEIENRRKAKKMTVNYIQSINGCDINNTRTISLTGMDSDLANDALDTIKKNTDVFFKPGTSVVLNNPIKLLGIYVGKFENIVENKKNNVMQLFLNHKKRKLDDQNNINSVEDKEQIEIFPLIKKEKNTYQIEENVNLEEKTIILADNSLSKISKVEQIVEESNVKKTSFFGIIKKTENIVESSDDKVLIEMKKHSIEKEETLINENIKFTDIPSSSTKLNILQDQTKSYEQSYAEFSRPHNLENLFEICKNCNAKILQIDLQEHLDRHYAFDLNRQQRYDHMNKITKNMMTKKNKLNITTLSEDTHTNTIKKFFVKAKDTSEKLHNDKNKNILIAGNNFLFSEDNLPKLEQPLLDFESSINNLKQLDTHNKVFNENCSFSIPCSSKINQVQWNNEEENSSVHNNITEICKTCNQKVSILDFQCHMDRHFAFELSQNQRFENHNDPIKKQKSTIKSKNDNKKKSQNIISYFKNNIS